MSARALRLLAVVLAVAAITAPQTLAQEDLTPSPTTGTGWRFADVSVLPEKPGIGGTLTVSFTVLDQAEQPINGLRVSALLRPPSNASDDVAPQPLLTVGGRSTDEPGRYRATLALNQAGSWWVEVEVQDSLNRKQRLARFVTVDSSIAADGTVINDPVFLPGDAWGYFYRLDAATGNISRLRGEEVIRTGDRWWLVQRQLEPLEPPNSRYGGTWRLSQELRDGLTGSVATTIDLGDIRASVHVGSHDQPAIASALTLSADGSQAYLYWARQLGQGWLAWVAVADTTTGEISQRRLLHGALAADGLWAKMSVSPDGHELILAEQIVRSAQASGYRLTTISATTLEPVASHRHTEAATDPLTGCLMAYPGPGGPVAGSSLRYSLCSPPGRASQLSLLVWNPVSGQIVHDVDLSGVAANVPYYVDGAVSPDGRYFYAVNTLARQIAEIDVMSGTIVRQSNLTLTRDDQPSPSTWDRLFDWFLGAIAPSASARVTLEPSLSMAPDGSVLYLVSPDSASKRTYGDGVWVINTATFEIREHLLAGEHIAGLTVAPSGKLVVVRHDSGSTAVAQQIATIDRSGQMLVSLQVPNRFGSAASR